MNSAVVAPITVTPDTAFPPAGEVIVPITFNNVQGTVEYTGTSGCQLSPAAPTLNAAFLIGGGVMNFVVNQFTLAVDSLQFVTRCSGNSSTIVAARSGRTGSFVRRTILRHRFGHLRR